MVKKLDPYSQRLLATQDMADITTPLKQFTDAVLAQEAAARKKEMVTIHLISK